jgi:hypothetical protein
MAQTNERLEFERTFKRLSQKLELVLKHLNVGLNIVEKFDGAESEADRELYSLLAKHTLSGSWNSLTKMLRQIAQEIDGDVPKGAGAAQKLVERMAQRTNDRNSILSIKNIETIQRIGKVHRDVRQSKFSHHASTEVIELLEAINDEIVPDMMENLRILALASPGGASLIGHFRPKGSDGNQQPIDIQRQAS